MISFRFHLVSIVAVFLALAIGVVMGYGILGQPTVEGLQNRIDTVEANAEARRQENDELKARLEQIDTSVDGTAPFALTDRLPEVPVLVVAVRGVDDATVKQAVEIARRGGARAPGVLWLEAKWALVETADTDALAEAVATSADKRSTVRADGWQALADRLATEQGIGTDVLRTLTDAGFVTFEGVGDAEVALADLGGTGARALVIVGTDGAVPARFVAAPLASAAVTAALPLVTAELFRAEEGGPGRGALLAGIRADEALAQQVSTVDDLDESPGVTVALLAVADLGRAVIGHYGFGEGASAAIPEWWRP